MARPKTDVNLLKHHIGIRIPKWLLESMRATGGVQKHVDAWLDDGINDAEPWLVSLLLQYVHGVINDDRTKLRDAMIVTHSLLYKAGNVDPLIVERVKAFIHEYD